MVYSRFYSAPFAFRHSLKAVFPYAPHLSVAFYVVKTVVALGTPDQSMYRLEPQRWSEWNLAIAKGQAGKPEVFASDELHQCLQRESPQKCLILVSQCYVDNPLDFCPQPWYVVLPGRGEMMTYQRKSNKKYAGRLFPTEGGSRLCFL